MAAYRDAEIYQLASDDGEHAMSIQVRGEEVQVTIGNDEEAAAFVVGRDQWCRIQQKILLGGING